jgi:hypothetical protein
MRTEAPTRRNAILIQNAEVAKAHMRRIMVIGERKRVVAVEPSMIGVASFLAFANRNHLRAPFF